MYLSVSESASEKEQSMPIEQQHPALERIVSPEQAVEELASGFGNDMGPAEGPLWWHEGGYLVFSDIRCFYFTRGALPMARELGEQLYGLAQRQAVPDTAQALAIARRQQARAWELRAATSLSRLWQGQGKRDAARQLLAEV